RIQVFVSADIDVQVAQFDVVYIQVIDSQRRGGLIYVVVLPQTDLTVEISFNLKSIDSGRDLREAYIIECQLQVFVCTAIYRTLKRDLLIFMRHDDILNREIFELLIKYNFTITAFFLIQVP